MNRTKAALLLVVYFALPLAATGALVAGDGAVVSDPMLFFSIFAGIAGFTWLTLQLVLSARLGFIERKIGHDRLLAFHRTMPVVSIALLLVHAGVKFFYYPTSLQKLSGMIIYLGFILVGLVSVVFLAKGGGRIGEALRRRFSEGSEKSGKTYQYYKKLHNFTFVLTAFVFFHVIISSLSTYTPVLRFYFIAVFLLGTAAYFYHKLIRPGRNPLYSVSEVLAPAEGVATLRFNLKEGRELRHVPGQFIFLRFPGKKTGTGGGPESERGPGPEEHPFTISGFPEMEITAKGVGDFSRALAKVKAGTPVKLDGPYGIFSYRNLPARFPMVFIAGGIGITPFLSMIRALKQDAGHQQEAGPKEQAEVRPLLIWGVRKVTDMVYHDELKQGSELIEIVEDDETWEGRRGRLDRGTLGEILPDRAVRKAVFFICGPPPMMKSVIGDLKLLGVTGRRIVVERFSL